MKYSNTVEYNIATKLDSSGLSQLQAQIKQVESALQRMANKKLLDPSQVVTSREQLSKFGEALTKSYNSSLGMLDFGKLRSELTDTGVQADKLQTAFRLSGAEGQQALAATAKELINFNSGMERTSSAVDKMYTTFSNTFRWGVISSFFSQFMNAIHQSVDYVKELDDSLTQIMLVTDYNRDSMNQYAKSANEAAKALSMSTTGMTNASLIFAQQGYNLEQSQDLATLSAKLANASQQDTATTSDQITAYMNAYGLDNNIQELSQAMDNWALIANVSAADVSELAQASQRAASMANAVGVSGEALAAQIATIESVTREAPEQIGNGLKTMYARFSDISLGKEDEDGVGLGKVTATLEKIGVQVLDQFGNIRSMDVIMEDLMDVWADLDDTTKTAAAQALAGKYQVNRFEALMNNRDMYEQYVGATGESAKGTLDTMNEEYANSLAGKSQKLQTTFEGLFNDVFNTDMIYPVIDSLTALADSIDFLLKSLGGGPNIVLGLATAFTQLFGQNIAKNIGNFMHNAEVNTKKQENMVNYEGALKATGIDQSAYGPMFSQVNDLIKEGAFNDDESYRSLVGGMEAYIDAEKDAQIATQELEESYLSLNAVMGTITKDSDNIWRDKENNEFNIENALTNLSGMSKEDWAKFDAMDWETNKNSINDFVSSIGKAQASMTAFKTEGSEFFQDQALDNLDVATDKLNILHEQGIINTDQYEKFKIVLDAAFEALVEGDKVNEAANDMEDLAGETSKVAERVNAIDVEKINQLRQGVNNLPQKDTTTKIQQDFADRKRADLQAFIDQKQQELAIKQTIEFAQGLGQVAFAMQSISSLGSIWGDKNLSEGEKLLQTFTNLTMTIPALLTGFEKLKQVTGVIKTLSTAQEILAAKSALAANANTGFALSNTVVAGATGLAAKAVGLLSAAFTKLQAAIPIIGPALVILTAGITAATAMMKAHAEELSDAADMAIKEYDKINEKSEVNTESFDKAYTSYKETGIVSDELKKSSSDLSNQLNITGGEALIAAGNFDKLAESIRNTKAESDIEAKAAAKRMYDRIAAEKNNDNFFDTNDWASKAKRIDDKYGNKEDKVGLGDENSSIIEQIGELNNLKDTVDQKVSDIESEVQKLEGMSDRQKATYSDSLGRNYIQSLEATKVLLSEANKDKQSIAELFDEDIEKIISTSQQRAKQLEQNLDMTKFKSKEEAQQQLTDLNGDYADIAQQWVLLGGQAGTDTSKEYINNLLAGLEEEKAPVQQLLSDMMRPEISGEEVKSADEFKDPLEKLYDTYDKNKGQFSTDEVADLLSEHAEYIEYLDKEGDHYVLNRRFLEEYTQAVRNQKQALDDLQGDSIDLRDNQSFLNDKLKNEEDPYQSIYSKLAAANTGMMQGELTSDDFLDTANEALATLTEQLGNIEGASDAAKKGMKEFVDILQDLDADAIGMVFDELYAGLKQSAKQFKSGQKTVGDYGEDLLQATETAKSFAETTGDTQSVEKFEDILDDGAQGAVEFSKAITDNYDQVTQVFDNNFDVLDSAMSATGGIAEQYRNTIQTMVTASSDFYTQNEEAASYMATALYEDLGDVGYSVEDLRTMLQEGSADLTNALMNDASAASTMMSGTASQTQAAISQMAQGLSSLISGVMQMIAGAQGSISGAPELTKGQDVHITAKDPTGNTSTVSMHVPGFNLKIKGSGSSGGGAGGVTSWSPTANNGSGGFVTKFDKNQTASGHAETRAATNEEIISSGALKDWSDQVATDLGEGIAGTINLDQYAPGTGRSGGGIPTRPSGGGGGGGKKGGSCFVAGTQISTSNGFKTIENINKYDSVLSYNIKTRQNEYSSVLQTMIHDTVEPIYTLYIKNEQLRVTGIHRFFIKRKLFEEPQWIATQDLKIGDRILLADGTWHLIWKIDVNTESQRVYNFEVADNHNYYVSRTQILAHNKGSGGSGGGGGGKAKTIEKKDKKEHEKDYYEEVKSQLNKTEKILSKIEKEQDRLIGDKARANQNKQLKLLEKEIKLQKEKLKILTEQEKKDVAKAIKDADKELETLAKKYGVISNIPDAVFDEDGVIQNYEEISKAIDATYNKLIDKRNALAEAGDEEGVKEMDKQLDKFDKQGEKLRKNVKRYDEIQTEIEELNATLEELDDSIEDIRIDAYKASQEAIDNLKELKELAAEQAKLFRDFDNNSFMNKFSIDDTPYGDLIEDLTKLQNTYSVTKKEANKFYDDLIKQKKDALKKAKDADEKQAIQTSIRFFEDQKKNLSSDTLKNGLLGLANQDLQQLQGWIDGTNKESNPFGKNEAALWEAYEDAYKRSLDLFKDYRETIQEFRDDIIDIYDEQEEGIERNIDKYEQTLEELERINDTYQLYYGEESYDNILSIMDQQTMTMQAQYAALQTAYQHWVEEYQKAIALGDEKLIQEIEDKMDNAKKAMLDKAQDLADHFIKRFETAIDGSVKKMVDQIWKGNGNVLSLDNSALLWEYDKDYEETYKDNVEKAFEVDKLRSKYIDLLNDAQGMSLQTQNKIRAQMQEQLDLLSNQATVSEYDVKLANAKLEILQKQIALEDAQRNKNKMQLRRDTQGNYRYVYTADQGDVKKAQDELAQSEYDAYEMTKQQTSANNDRYINLLQDYANKIAEIDKNMNLEAEEKQKLREELEAKFMRAMKALGEDYQDVTAGMYDVLTWMVENSTQDTADAAVEMLDTLYDKNGEVKENTGQAWRDFATEVTNSFENVEDAVTTQMQTARAEADKLKDEMVGDKGVLNDIGSGVDTLKESLKGATEQTQRWANATQDLFDAFSSDNKKLQEAQSNLKAMEDQLKANQQATSTLSTKYKEANAQLQAKKAESLNYKTILDVKNGAKELKVGDRYILRKGTKVHFHRNDQQWDANNNTTRALPEDVQVTVYDTNEQQDGKQARNFIAFYRTGKDPQEESKGAGGTNHVHEEVWHLSANDFKNAITYDSGGYTGDWAETTPDNKNGKWALLHQKELILNAKDTENILAATKFVRELVAAKTGAATLSAQLQKVQAQNSAETIEQRVEISATFPNATNADDIRNALIGLSDRAYQYAHKNI